MWDLSSDLRRRGKQADDEKIRQVTNDLEKSLNLINSAEELRNWQKQLAELKKLVEPYLLQEKQQEAIKVAGKLSRNAEELYKYTNLRSQVFAVGAYCLFKKQYKFIKLMLDYKQPADSDTIWMSDDIHPSALSDIINYYFRRISGRRDFDFWEGHHGSGIYVKEYFIVLMLRSFVTTPHATFNLSGFNTDQLSDITYSIEGLKQVALGMEEDEQLFRELSLDKSLVRSSVIPTLENLAIEAKKLILETERSKPISTKKIEDFKIDVQKAFSRASYMRSLFDYYQKLKDETNKKYKGKVLRAGISRVDDKAVFFDNWHVSYVNWGENFGQNIAQGENIQLFNEIYESSIKYDGSIDGAIRLCSNPILIVLSRSTFGYGKIESFTEKWQLDVTLYPEAGLSNFIGIYKHQNKVIPVFEARLNMRSRTEVLVIDTEKLGTLHIYSPLAVDDETPANKSNFDIKVEAFSDNQELLESFLNKPPKWLEEVGNVESQKSYLLSKVVIKVYERFKLANKGNKNVGYIVYLGDN